MMDIFAKLNDRYTALAMASFRLDAAEREKLIAEYQSRWDDGERFVARGGDTAEMFLGIAKRDADTEEELDACVNQLACRIKDALVAQWAKQYDRPQMVALLNAIAGLDANASMNVHGMTVEMCEIIRAWEKTHPDADRIRMNSGVSI